MKKLAMAAALSSGLFYGWNPAAPAGRGQTATQPDGEIRLASNDEITVTAQRRAQSQQDVGIALTVFSGADLIAQGVSTVNNLENFTPNLEIESQFGSGQPSFSIRGVGFRDYATNNAPTVGIYVDDVAYPVPVMTQGVLFDIERVEVLRGPQGHPLRPQHHWRRHQSHQRAAHGGIRGGASWSRAAAFGRVDAEGFVSGAVSDAVRVRISGATAHGGAWQENRETGEEIGDAEQYALRGLAEIDIAPNVEALFNLHGFIDKSDGLGLQLFNDSVFGPLAHARRETSFGASEVFADLTGVDADQHPFRDNEGWGANLTLNAALGEVDLTYIGAFETLNRKELNDFGALPFGLGDVYFESSVDVMSHELRAQGDAADGRLRWVSGLFYGEEDLDEVYQSDFTATDNATAVSTLYRQDVRTMAVYLHTDYDLTEIITLVAGLRYEDEEAPPERPRHFRHGVRRAEFRQRNRRRDAGEPRSQFRQRDRQIRRGGHADGRRAPLRLLQPRREVRRFYGVQHPRPRGGRPLPAGKAERL